jgi:GST-like protein
MAGQAHHFRHYAPKKVAYGIERYTKEVTRLYGVLDKRLKGRSYIAGDYSIADMASYPWMLHWKRQGQAIADFPRVEAWLARVSKREAVQRGMSVALT